MLLLNNKNFIYYACQAEGRLLWPGAPNKDRKDRKVSLVTLMERHAR